LPRLSAGFADMKPPQPVFDRADPWSAGDGLAETAL
jgi:hypothetical protein